MTLRHLFVEKYLLSKPAQICSNQPSPQFLHTFLALSTRLCTLNLALGAGVDVEETGGECGVPNKSARKSLAWKKANIVVRDTVGQKQVIEEDKTGLDGWWL